MKPIVQRMLLFGILMTAVSPAVYAVELGACEAERSKIVFVLKSVFKPYLRNIDQLPDMRQQIIDLSKSMNGWVEDIDDCYRAVFRQNGAPVDNASINNGLDWSVRLVEFNKLIQAASQQLKQTQASEELWVQLDQDLEGFLPEVFVPNFSYDAYMADGGAI